MSKAKTGHEDINGDFISHYPAGIPAPARTRKPRTPAAPAPLDVRTTALEIARILEQHATQAERERVLEILHVMAPPLP
jgi:hypothetical protein